MGAFPLGDLVGPLAGLHAEEGDDVLDGLLEGLHLAEGVGVLQLVLGAELLPRGGEVGLHRALHEVGHAQLEVLQDVLVGISERGYDSNKAKGSELWKGGNPQYERHTSTSGLYETIVKAVFAAHLTLYLEQTNFSFIEKRLLSKPKKKNL